MSTVLRRDRPGRTGEGYLAYFVNPYNVARTILLALGEIITELWNAADDRRRDVQPRVNRGFPYPLLRAWTTVVQRDLQIEAVIGDMYAGRPVVYTDVLGYDEVAHHSGTERHDTLRVLRRVDRQLARLEKAAGDARRPYVFVVLSDHGQTQGPTFRQRWGQTLDDVVRQASDSGDIEVHRQGDESWGYLSGSVTNAIIGPGLRARAVRAMTRARTVNGMLEIGPRTVIRSALADGATKEPPEIVVLASGCLGLVYFARRPGRLSLEDIERLYPRVIPTLREHPGVGFMLVRSSEQGAIVIGRSGVRYLDRGTVEGVDPLADFGPNAAIHVKRADGFPHAADIMINSAYDPMTEEVFAFEELVGSHGGLGGPQSFPFIVLPATWALPSDEVVGAEEMHRWMRQWLGALGHEQYLDH
jgi:Type I phosphodiesterase / nucleotide pyrophosphatase